MIRLKQLLTEITLGSVTPYATQFVWNLTRGAYGETYETQFSAEGTQIVLIMHNGGEGEWHFAFLLPTRDTGFGSGRTTSNTRSTGAAGSSYIRIIRTIGEAILDFCVTHEPEAVNITGDDSDAAKAAQKTRLYLAFLRDNASRLTQIGYRVTIHPDPRSGALDVHLVRTSRADTTGIE